MANEVNHTHGIIKGRRKFGQLRKERKRHGLDLNYGKRRGIREKKIAKIINTDDWEEVKEEKSSSESESDSS